jgi:hypothetical protein
MFMLPLPAGGTPHTCIRSCVTAVAISTHVRLLLLLLLICLGRWQGPLLLGEVVVAAVALLRPLAAQLSSLQYLDMALALQHKDVAALHDALHRWALSCVKPLASSAASATEPADTCLFISAHHLSLCYCCSAAVPGFSAAVMQAKPEAVCS